MAEELIVDSQLKMHVSVEELNQISSVFDLRFANKRALLSGVSPSRLIRSARQSSAICWQRLREIRVKEGRPKMEALTDVRLHVPPFSDEIPGPEGRDKSH